MSAVHLTFACLSAHIFHLSAQLEESALKYPLEGCVASEDVFNPRRLLSFCPTVAQPARLVSQLSDAWTHHSCQRKEAGEEGERAGLALMDEESGEAAEDEAQKDGEHGDQTAPGETGTAKKNVIAQNGDMIWA